MNKYYLLLFVLLTLPGISAQELASQEHDTDTGTYNSIVQVDADTYVLAYTGTDGDGFIKTFTISSDGTSITQITVLEHDAANGKYNSLVHVVGDTYALAYSGADEDGDDTGDGFISTFTINSAGDITPIRVANHVALGEGSVNLEHDTANGEHNSLVHVVGDTYAHQELKCQMPQEVLQGLFHL